MTIQSHLFSNEIIGYNAGYSISIDELKQKCKFIFTLVVFIHETFPCWSLEGENMDWSKEVEMDYESSHEQKWIAEERN